MKKLPKINQFELSNVKNNKKVFDSLKEEKNDIENVDIKKDNKEILTVKEKLKKLIKEDNYIFNKEVTLIFDSYEEKCNIAGIVNNHIITMDNNIIKIDDLKDIKY